MTVRQAHHHHHKSVPLLEDERWWGGAVAFGQFMPFDKSSSVTFDLCGDTYGNQAQPLLISTHGRVIRSDQPFRCEVNHGVITLDGPCEIHCETAGHTLDEAYRAIATVCFRPTGALPHERLFTAPQYNTWIELQYNQNQRDLIAYAKAILAHGFPPGVLMIDDTWQEDYGVWRFHPGRFPNPTQMVDELHAMGFLVMLWIVPYISPDSPEARHLHQRGWLVRDTAGQPAMGRWWNGASAILDLTHPSASAWLGERLEQLQATFGVDGFKFDGGDARIITEGMALHESCSGNDYSRLYAEFGASYALNEFRACWKAAGLPLAQRLRDKHHTWEHLRELIPCTLAQGLLGYAYGCPDMIGGGEYTSFQTGAVIDEELVVRWAQCSALLAMMQFSVAPWRVLSEANTEHCRQAAVLHTSLADEILAIARDAATTGEPIVRSCGYVFPHAEMDDCVDQFMLGPDIMVAPVLEPDTAQRTVRVPPGRWHSENHETLHGPATVTIDAPLSRIPWWRRCPASAEQPQKEQP